MLEVKNLKKSFGSRVILDNVNVTVKDREILSIVGPSGAGKTTLLRCIAGMERADSGQFLIDGVAFDPAANDTSESVIGVVFQDFNLFPHLTVFENIMLAPTMVLKKTKSEAKNEAKTLLNNLGLDDKGELYPHQLSGGQKQRVALARALAMHPKILCYDEPTSALDPNLRREVEKMILKLKQEGMTQLVVTHDMEFAKVIADDILEVNDLESSDQK